jgi:hypothetical protein
MRDTNRMRRLLHPPDCDFLVALVARHAQESGGDVHLCWETAAEKTGYQRIIAQIPVRVETFDTLFNGRRIAANGFGHSRSLPPRQIS